MLFLYLKLMMLISTYLYPYTQVDLSLSLEGKISPMPNAPLDILPYSTMFPLVQNVLLCSLHWGECIREQWKEQVSLKCQA